MKEDRPKRLRQIKATHQKDRNRIVFLVVTLALVLIGYFQVGSATDEQSQTSKENGFETVISLPPINFELLAEVKDASDLDRRILEPEPLRHLAKMSQALHAGHLRSLKEPAVPFSEITNTPEKYRGQAYRIRGQVLNIDIATRRPGAPKEFWCQIRTDQGDEIIFASMQVPTELFGSENYVRADGFFLKNYSWQNDGELITAPLIVGREIVPSSQLIENVSSVDSMLLNSVRDQAPGVNQELDQEALWHLLGHSRWLRDNPKELDSVFAKAPEMDFDFLAQLAAEPELFRGKAIQVPGRVPDNSSYRWGEIAGENPQRANWLRFGYLGNLAFSDHPILLVSTDEMDFGGNSARWYLGHFLQLKGYLDTKDTPRRAPVFVVSGFREAERSTPAIVGEMVWWFVVIGVSVLTFMFWAAARDRKSSQLAAEQVRKRRENRKQQNNTPNNKT